MVTRAHDVYPGPSLAVSDPLEAGGTAGLQDTSRVETYASDQTRIRPLSSTRGFDEHLFEGFHCGRSQSILSEDVVGA